MPNHDVIGGVNPIYKGIELTTLDPVKRPLQGFVDGLSLGRVKSLRVRLSNIAAAEIAFLATISSNPRFQRSVNARLGAIDEERKQKDAEQRFKTREEQARQDEAAVRKKLATVEQELGIVRAQRASRAKELPVGVLVSYDRILKARGGVAVAAVSAAGVCGGCRVGIRPQALQELRGATGLMVCESCGRYLYWQE